MSRENVEAAGRFWERFSASAASGWIDDGAPDPVLDPDVQYVEDGRWPGSGVYSGSEAVRARFAEYLDIFGPMRVTLHEAFDLGDKVGLVFGTRGESGDRGGRRAAGSADRDVDRGECGERLDDAAVHGGLLAVGVG